MRGTNSISNLWLLLYTFLLMAGCNESFQPLKENNRYSFNISGYLDAAADTQWVRVGTIRESIHEPPNPEGIQVTLEDLQSGESVVMNDSVFISKNVLNYWATMDIENEQTYHITVEGATGKKSSVTVTTPKKLPTIYIILRGGSSFYGDSEKGATIYINDAIENIADVQSVWYVTVKAGSEYLKRIYRFSIRSTLKHSDILGDSYAFANWDDELESIKQSIGNAEIFRSFAQFFVAIGGPEWDGSLSSIDDLEYFLDGTGSNVENGLGYVVGISSGWYRQTTCLNSDRSGYAPCEQEAPLW